MGRPVGGLEKFSTSRHNLGIYHCVCSTARYTKSSTSKDLRQTIRAALTKAILQHPSLCHGIINEDKNEPEFVLLDSINLNTAITWIELTISSAEEFEENLIETLQHQHSIQFSDISQCPPWKLIIMEYHRPDAVKEAKFEAIFSFHHAIGDGMSGMIFHRSFLAALASPLSSESPSTVVDVPKELTLSPPIEKCVDFKISWSYFLGQLWNSVKPSWWFPPASIPWTAGLISEANINDYHSRVKIFSLPADIVSKILAECRKQKTTLTGLLHGLSVASFASRVPHASSFSSSTPFSLRHLTGLSVTEDFAVQVSTLSSIHDYETVTSLREARIAKEITSKIWNIARKFNKDMFAELATLPNDNQLGMIPYISNMHSFWTKKFGTARHSTYEISNVGVLRPKNDESAFVGETGEGWMIERVIFTQSGMGTGAALGINVSSVVGGELGVSFTWLRRDIEEELVVSVLQDLERGLRCVGEGREIDIGL